MLAITETTLSETNDPTAQPQLTLKVGVKPRPATPNGHVVRIIVSFYDLTNDNRMKPTNAQVSYNWFSSARDWTEETPKFLAATYVRSKCKPTSSVERTNGGSICNCTFDRHILASS